MELTILEQLKYFTDIEKCSKCNTKYGMDYIGDDIYYCKKCKYYITYSYANKYKHLRILWDEVKKFILLNGNEKQKIKIFINDILHSSNEYNIDDIYDMLIITNKLFDH